MKATDVATTTGASLKTRNFTRDGIEISKIIWGDAWKITAEDIENVQECAFSKAKREYLEAKAKYNGVKTHLSKFGGLLIEISEEYLANLEADMKAKSEIFTSQAAEIERLIWADM